MTIIAYVIIWVITYPIVQQQKGDKFYRRCEACLFAEVKPLEKE